MKHIHRQANIEDEFCENENPDRYLCQSADFVSTTIR